MLVFDIETGPLPEERLKQLMPPCELKPHPGEFDPATVKLGQMKDQAKIDAKISEAREKHKAAVANYEKEAAEKLAEHEAAFIERAALNAGTGQVLAIGLLKPPDAGQTQSLKKILVNEQPADDDHERQLLNTFWGMSQEIALTKGQRFVGHNIHGFDLPFLIRRSWLLQVPVPDGIFNGRYFHENFIDTMKLWACGAYNGFVGLNELASYLGLPGKNGNGADFAGLLKTDRDAAVAYLRQDLILTHKVAERLGVR